jgi:ribosome-associated toxin RatA of RatAB toxin-antitoxin module
VGQRASESINVNATPEALFAVVVDFPSYPSWVADLKQVSVMAHDENGAAQDVEFRAAAFGRSSTYTLRYDYSAAPNAVSWSQVTGDLTTKLDGRYRFDADGSGTKVTYELDVVLMVPLPGFVKNRAASRIMTQALRELKARAERGA